MKTDAELRDDVVQELRWDPQVAEPDHVGVADGAVTLTGHTTTYAEKLAAARAAERVYGVKSVADDLQVRLAGSPQDDADIARAVAHVLEWNVQIPAGRVQARVQDGWVSLDGQVDYDFQRHEADGAGPAQRQPPTSGARAFEYRSLSGCRRSASPGVRGRPGSAGCALVGVATLGPACSVAALIPVMLVAVVVATWRRGQAGARAERAEGWVMKAVVYPDTRRVGPRGADAPLPRLLLHSGVVEMACPLTTPACRWMWRSWSPK